jgi:hypothetical protein
MKLRQAITILTMPFSFNGKGTRPDMDSIWQRCTVTLDKGKLYSHIQTVLQNPDPASESGYIIYSLSDKATHIKNLIKRDIHLITKDNEGQTKVVEFKFGQAEDGKIDNQTFFSPKLLIHPSSNVGMLILSCCLADRNRTMEDLITLNYCIHRTFPAGSGQNKVLKIKQLDQDNSKDSISEDTDTKIVRTQKLQALMKNVFGTEDAFSMSMFTEILMAEFKGKYERFDPFRLHLFTYLQMSEPSDKVDLLKDFSRIIKLQNRNYKVVDSDKADSVYEETFKNIYVGSAVEGGGMMTLLSDQDDDSCFLKDFHRSSLSQIYLWIYFMVQIQKYTLISIERSLTDYDFTNKNTNESRKKLAELIASLTKNKINSHFVSISSHTQHNKFYSLCCKNLDIERLSAGLNQKISYFKEHLDILTNEEEVRLAKIENDISKRREDSMTTLTVVASAMALFSVAYDSFGLLDESHFMLYHTADTEPWIRNLTVICVVAIVAAIALAVTRLFLRKKR